MKDFLADKLHIVHDEVLHVNEAIAIAIVIVLALLLIVIIKDLIKHILNNAPGRKKTIFSHRKNKYKNRIGKKNKF